MRGGESIGKLCIEKVYSSMLLMKVGVATQSNYNPLVCVCPRCVYTLIRSSWVTLVRSKDIVLTLG